MGKSWIKPSGGGILVYSLVVIDSTLFIGNTSSYPLRSSDLGINWAVCDSGFPEWGAPYLAAANNILIAGTNLYGIYFSSNMGDSWK